MRYLTYLISDYWYIEIRYLKAIIHHILELFISSILFYPSFDQSYISGLLWFMNCAARLIFRISKHEHITPYLEKLHWLPVEDRITFQVLTITHRCVFKTGPVYLNSLVSLYKSSRDLRSSDTNLLEKPKYRNKYGYRAFRNVAPRFWNDLPLQLRQTEDISCFKKALKTDLFKKAFNC